MEEAEQEKKMQTTESGHGNNFCLDVIGKSCNITLNVEHGRSSGCWRYLVCLKPSLPPTANIESKSRTVSHSPIEKKLWENSPRHRTVLEGPVWATPRLNNLIPYIPNTANFQYLTFLTIRNHPKCKRYFKQASSDPRIKQQLLCLARNVAS